MAYLKYEHISKAADEAASYVAGRRSGQIKSLRTSKRKLNEALLGGVEWHRIFTIAGLSGSGKSIICEEMKKDLIELNPDEDFEILSFEFEMLARDQVARTTSGKLSISTKELYSASTPLDESTYNNAVDIINEVKKYPIYYVDEVGTVDDVVDTISKFYKDRIAGQNKGLIITIDHLLLTKGKSGESEKKVVDNLMHSVVALRKKFVSMGQKVLFILLSQLNRDIESKERVTNRNLHYPIKNDIFAASSVYYSSDYVLVTHKPSDIEGIRTHYGPPLPESGWPDGLPLYNPDDPEQAMVYWHLIKERFGEKKIMLMLDDFKHSRVLEFDNQ